MTRQYVPEVVNVQVGLQLLHLLRVELVPQEVAHLGQDLGHLPLQILEPEELQIGVVAFGVAGLKTSKYML